MDKFQYNYVVFNWLFSEDANIKDDYYAICVRDLENREDIIVNHYPLQGRPKFVRKIYKLLHSKILYNRYLKLFPSIWYPYIFKNTFKDEKPLCFVCIRYPEPEYLLYLKKNYPHSKVVVLCRDVLRRHMYNFQTYTRKKVYDFWMSIDERECKEYGFVHFDEFESVVDVPRAQDYPIADLFFAGRTKDRLERLVSIYDKMTAGGIKCLFLMLDTRKEDEVAREGIKYIDKPLTYTEMLWYSVNSKCMLEINQEDAVGYTSRFLEAVMFNKKLITDNTIIKENKFYNPNFISIISQKEEIDVDFIKEETNVNYHYNGEFSPLARIEQIDKMLINGRAHE